MESRALGFPTKTALTLTILGLSCACGGTVAGTFQPDDREDEDRRLPVFRALDNDRDGALSASEIAAATESLASLDADGDGQISSGELRSRPRVFFGGPADLPEGTNIITLDARDGDGSLDLSEVPPEARRFLAAGDTDGDGAASAAELLALMAAQGGGLSGAAEGTPSLRVPLVAALDADQDGAISASEIESAPQSLRTLDSDGDGRVSPAELQPDTSSGNPPE